MTLPAERCGLRALVGAVAGMLLLHGCAVVPPGPSVLVLPGPQKSQAHFQADQTVCRQQAQAQVAPAVDAANQQAAATAVVGTAIGAAVGALVGYGGYGGYGHYANQSAAWGAGAGLAYGGAVGGSGSQAANVALQQRYDAAFVQCMVGLGNQVPGMTGYRHATPAVPPPPPGYRSPTVPPRDAVPPAVPPPDTPPPIGVTAPT
jgi:hypothetical protein